MLMARFGGLRALGLRRLRAGHRRTGSASRRSSPSAPSTARSAARRRSSSPASAAASASTATLVVPTDLSQFDEYPFIKALDPGARPSDDPMAELDAQSRLLPDAARESFWFAAGISLQQLRARRRRRRGRRSRSATASRSRCSAWRAWRCRGRSSRSCRSSSAWSRASRPSEGVLWVQAQLTDNSWLLYQDVRLTGGFAFVTLVQGAEPRPVRADDRRLPPALPPRRLPGGAAPGPAVAARRRDRDQGRVVLRADLRGGHGGRAPRGLGRVRAGVGARRVRRRRHRLLRPVPLRGRGLRVDLAPA